MSNQKKLYCHPFYVLHNIIDDNDDNWTTTATEIVTKDNSSPAYLTNYREITRN